MVIICRKHKIKKSFKLKISRIKAYQNRHDLRLHAFLSYSLTELDIEPPQTLNVLLEVKYIVIGKVRWSPGLWSHLAIFLKHIFSFQKQRYTHIHIDMGMVGVCVVCTHKYHMHLIYISLFIYRNESIPLPF